MAPQDKVVGDSSSMDQKSRMVIAGQLGEEAGPPTPRISPSRTQETVLSLQAP